MRTLAEAEESVAQIVAAWRASEALVAATVALGFEPATAADGLAAELEAWEAPGALARVWRRDFGGAGPGAARPDEPGAEPDDGPDGGETAPPPARLPRQVLVLAARTLPASAMRQILWARALGAEVALKPATGQEALGRALCEATGLPGLTSLPAARGEATARALAQADTVIALGSDETLAELRRSLRVEQTFVGYGHRFSAALVVAPLTPAAAGALAQDLVAWDQSGCLSPRVLWVHAEAAASSSGLAALPAEVLAGVVAPLAEVLAAAGVPPLSPGAAQAQRVVLTRALMTGQRVTRAGTWVLAAGGATEVPDHPRWLVIAPFQRRAFEALAASLSTLGLSPDVPHDLLPPLPASLRPSPLGAMQRPPLDWLQDGLHPLRALLRPV